MPESIGRYPASIQREFIHLVGTIVTWWARTEGVMAFDIRWLRTQPLSASIIRQEAFPTHTKRTIRHWGKLLRNGWRDDPAKLADLEHISNEAFALLEHRNTIVHSFWPYGQDEPDKIKLTSFKLMPGGDATVFSTEYVATVDDLNEINERMSRLYHRVMAFSMNSHVLADRDPAKSDIDEG